MSQFANCYGKENVNICPCKPKNVPWKQPLHELPANIKVRTRSTSSVGRIPSAINNNRNLLQLIDGQCNLVQGSVSRQPKSANYIVARKQNFIFDFAINEGVRVPIKGPVIREPPQLRHSTVIAQTNIKRQAKIQKRSDKQSNSSKVSYVDDFYNLEYIEDIIVIARRDELKFILNDNFMEEMSHNHIHRASSIRWLQSLRLQNRLRIRTDVFYLAVNLLDQILARSPVRAENYDMVLLCSVWIADKLIGGSTTYMSASSLIRCTEYENNYPQVLIHLEQNILKILNYNVHSIEPTIFVNYFLKKNGLSEYKLAYDTIQRLIDYLANFPQFSIYPCSVIAAGAIDTAIKLHYPRHGYHLDAVYKRIFNADEIDLKNDLITYFLENHDKIFSK